MAVISDSPGPHAIFITTPDHDKKGIILLRISANSLATDGCSVDVRNWLIRRLANGIYVYFSWCNLEYNLKFIKTTSDPHIFLQSFFLNQIIIWQYTVWDSNIYLMKYINWTILQINNPY